MTIVMSTKRNIYYSNVFSKLFDIYRLPGTLSQNAAIFASVILASRLHSPIEVFAFITIAVNWFVLVPTFLAGAAVVTKWSLAQHASVLFTAMVVSVVFVMRPVTTLVILLVVSVGLPSIFFWMQQYKMKISGPWDEALPQLLDPSAPPQVHD